jgi:hypothetical protein
MPKPYTPYIPQGKSEIMDKLASLMLSKPPFEDDSGYFPGKNIDTEFFALNEGLRLIQQRLGEERYQALRAMSDRMRMLFDASPDGESDELDAGRAIILDMRELLIRKD